MTENESEILRPVLYGDTSIYLTWVRSSSNKSKKFYNNSKKFYNNPKNLKDKINK